MKKVHCIALLVLLTAISLPRAVAQDKAGETGAAPSSGFRADFLNQLGDLQKKVLDLAGAMPQDKYTWRPMQGVRSVSEVYMHIAGSNFSLPAMVGIKAPEGYSRDMEKTVTDKKKVIAVVKQSFDHLRKAMIDTPDADLDKPATFFGTKTTVRDVFFRMALHLHEHLGQSIAYARMNGVVPPWTAAEEAQAKEKGKK